MDTHDDEAMVGSTVETGPASHAVKTSAAEDSLKIYDAEADVAGACEEIMTLRKIAACRHIVRSEKVHSCATVRARAHKRTWSRAPLSDSHF